MISTSKLLDRCVVSKLQFSSPLRWCVFPLRNQLVERFPCHSASLLRLRSGGAGLGLPPSPRLLPACVWVRAESGTSFTSMEEQFEEFRVVLDEIGAVRERFRGIVSNLDSTIRLMQAGLLPIHHSSCPAIEARKKMILHIPALQERYAQLAEVIKDCPDQYYRYHDHWRNQTNAVVFLLAFLHWLDTGDLLTHAEAEARLGLDPTKFFIDIEDYLIGLCNVSNELPRYVTNRVTAGDYNCPKKVSVFLGDLSTAFRLLNLRNDHLRKKFDGMKYDLKKVEEVLYDVTIRRLADAPQSSPTNTQPSEAIPKE